MTESGLEGMVCLLISSLGFKPVRSRECKEAPDGTYYSVGISGIDPVGKIHDSLSYGAAYQFTASLVVWEVEGDGEGIRAISRALDSRAFRDMAEEQNVAVWDIGGITDMSQADGPFWIRQRRMEITLAFNDDVESTRVRMISLDASGEGVEITAGIT